MCGQTWVRKLIYLAQYSTKKATRNSHTMYKHYYPHFGGVAQLKGLNWCKLMHSEDSDEMFMVLRQPCSLISVHDDYEPSMTGKYHFAQWCGRLQLNSPQYEEVSNNLRNTNECSIACKYGIPQNGGGWPQIESRVSPEPFIYVQQCNEATDVDVGESDNQIPVYGGGIELHTVGCQCILIDWYVGLLPVNGGVGRPGQTTREWPWMEARWCPRQDCDQRLWR